MRYKKIEYLHPSFIEHFPDQLDPGVLYVSMKYAICAHACACGCGQKVITPLSPTKWELTYDGDSVSLFPSIGNYGLPCKSHYFLTKGRIEWVNDKTLLGEAKKKTRKNKYGRFSWLRKMK